MLAIRPILALTSILLACETAQAHHFFCPGGWYRPTSQYVVVQPRVYSGYTRYLHEQTELLRAENEQLRLARARELESMRDDYHELVVRQDLRRSEKDYDGRNSQLVELASLYRLDKRHFNTVTGRISWPLLAESPRYSKHRRLIEEIVTRIARYDLWNDPAHLDELALACGDFRDQLREDYAEFRGESVEDSFLAVQRFLLGIKYSPYLMGHGFNTPERVAAKQQATQKTDKAEDIVL